MTVDESQVSERQCQEWRVAYHAGKSPYELAVESDYPRREVHNHLIGECSHDVEEASISRGRTHTVTASECRDIRDRYAAGSRLRRYGNQQAVAGRHSFVTLPETVHTMLLSNPRQ